MNFLQLTHEKLSVDLATEYVAAPNCGAVSLFVGITRDNFEDKKVLKLEYEVYESMAEKCMEEICLEMRQKWAEIENIAIHHRLGVVPVKEASIIIAVSSPHRADALEATQWCIDKVKQTVPIWKKEIYENNEPQWKENNEYNKSDMKTEIKQDVISSNISSHLIQITCSNEELARRIDAFILRKRIRANNTNIRDLCGERNTSDSCARVDAKFKRQKNSNSHLKTQRVYNTYGPYNVKTLGRKSYISPAIEQRINDIENCLEICKPVSPDIYQRLKQIEDRMLYLESISPEYANFWNKHSGLFGNNFTDDQPAVLRKPKYTINDLDKYLFELTGQAHYKM